MKIKLALITTTLLFGIFATAHEGHDHGAPTFQPPKGGVLKSALQGHFELVKSDDLISIYAYSKDGKALPTKGLTLGTTLELPRKKPAPLLLTDKGTHWEAKVDAQGTHRFTLKIAIDNGKEKDHVSFTIENH